jgi:endonuclease I
MHNIFLTNGRLNSYRSNYKFVDESEYLIKKNNAYYFKNNELIIYNSSINYRNNTLKLFIPIHSSRGLIARSIAYMKYTYEDLVLENVIDKNILLKWNSQYPPSEIEKKQNILITEIQGNENIFITNYELVNIFFKNVIH